MKNLLKQFSDLPFGFGCASISGEGGGYGFGPIAEKDAVELLHKAFESGVRLFDTAPIYGFGVSEKRLGLAFKRMREKIFLVSKSGVGWHRPSMRVNMSNDPKQTLNMLEQSLRDLQSEYIDLYMIHWPDKNVDIRKPMEVLARCRDQGKVKHIGLCNTNWDDLCLAQEVAPLSAVQSELNIFNQSAYAQVHEYTKKEELSFMSWGTLDKGIISGSIKKKQNTPKEDCRGHAPWWDWDVVEKKSAAMEKILPVLKEHHVSPLEFAIGHNMSFENVDMVLIGAKSQAQLETTIHAMESYPKGKKLENLMQDVAPKLKDWSL